VEALMTSQPGRVVIIGAGPNGLVTAFYLAKAGFSPVVLEHRDVAGGIAVNEEIHPGFRCPAIMHSAGPLLPAVMKDLEPEKHGMQIHRPSVEMVALNPDGPALRIYHDPRRTVEGLAAHSKKDTEKYSEFLSCFSRLGAALAPALSTTPPDVETPGLDDYLNLGKFGLKLRSLERKDLYRLLRWGPMAVADLAAEWFDSELLRAVLAARGIFGMRAGPWSAGTSVPLLMQAALGGDALLIRGGTGALAQAFAKAATAAGAQIRTNAKVDRIRVKDGEVVSAVLNGGEEVLAKTVVSSVDPRQTFTQLIDATNFDPAFLMRIRAYRTDGVVAKVNLALSGLPAFSGIDEGNEDMSGRVQIGPNIDYLERAFDASKYGQFSAQPYLDITVPSLADPSLAPAGSHVMSIHMQFAPYHLKNGDWNSRRDDLTDAVINTIAAYSPKIRDLIVGRQVITPLDLEQTFGLSGGHIFHGEHALDQLFAFRPILGWARYRTPIRGLYLCGSGTHPGGGITGGPGANASREILRDLKSGRSR
jgi:phytoene dehydrogenase-like protein